MTSPIDCISPIEAVRLECLRLASGLFASVNEARSDAVVVAAGRFADFVLGTKDAEILAAAKAVAASKALAEAMAKMAGG